jgi:hypothetical protein
MTYPYIVADQNEAVVAFAHCLASSSCHKYGVEMEWLIFSPLAGVAAKLFRKSPTCFGPSPSPLVSSLAAWQPPGRFGAGMALGLFWLGLDPGKEGRRLGGKKPG